MNPSDLPVTNALDIAILMHRDAHFSGSFDFMLDYYAKEGKGCHPDFTLEQIKALCDLERTVGENLSALVLSGADAEKVARAKEMYKGLRDLYEIKNPESTIPQLIADLILSEEEEPVKEMEAIIREKRAAIPALIDLIRSEDLHDPLFPGYGLTGELAAKCLGKIGDKHAISSLFESIRENDFFEEDASLLALKWIGAPARDFLLTILKSHPITADNERAAIALVQFDGDPIVASDCLKMLQELNTKKQLNRHLPLATYLILGCSGLSQESDREALKKMAEEPLFPSMLKQDIKSILKLSKS